MPDEKGKEKEQFRGRKLGDKNCIGLALYKNLIGQGGAASKVRRVALDYWIKKFPTRQALFSSKIPKT